MALTYSPDGGLSSHCPDFDLKGTDQKRYSLRSFSQSELLLVIFSCNHCPYVQALENRILTLAKSYSSTKVQFIAICSNDGIEYPEDSFEEMQKRAMAQNYSFPYLHDETQAVARAFGAVCTPEFFLYSPDRKLIYRGRFDDNWKDVTKVKHQDLKAAIDAALAQKPPSTDQLPAMGCSIKWRFS
jgi:peroxiredoxin